MSLQLDISGSIAVSTDTNYWGPFAFEFSKTIPSGDSLTSQTTTSQFSDGTDTTALLIAPGSVIISGSSIQLRLNYPGDSLIGKHSLWFELTLASGAQHRFIFGYVVVTK